MSNEAVLNPLRLEDRLQILSHGRGPSLETVPWKIEKNDLSVCQYPYKYKVTLFLRATRQMFADH